MPDIDRIRASAENGSANGGKESGDPESLVVPVD